MNAIRPRLALLLKMNAGWVALVAALALTLLGIEAVRPLRPDLASKQTLWCAAALVAMLLCLLPKARVIGLASYALLAATIAALVFLALPGIPESIVPNTNGARAWIDLGFMRLQPSELAKIAFVLAVAWYLRHRESFRTLPGLLVPFAIMLAPVALLLRQPDLGMAMLFPIALLVMLIAAGAKLRHIGSLAGCATVLAAVVIAAIYVAPGAADAVLKQHQQNRIRALGSQIMNDSRYDDTINYQQMKAMMLAGSGGMVGYGADRSATLVQVHALPEAHNDMIFAVIANRWGLVGAATVLASYVVMTLAFALIAARSKDPFVRLAMVGFGGLLFTQAFINIAVNVGLLPVTGITLPFVSYGGSSLVSMYAMIGLAINFASHKAPPLARPSFEFTHAEPAAA